MKQSACIHFWISAHSEQKVTPAEQASAQQCATGSSAHCDPPLVDAMERAFGHPDV
jgi:hypothetical protein